MAKYLYLEPTLYMPYKISLRRKEAIVLDRMWIEHGDEIDLVKFKPRPKREINGNFIRMEFSTPLYMDVEPLNGVDEVVTFVMKYKINFGDGNFARIVHRQHIAVRHKDVAKSLTINHFTTRYATPAIFGIYGKKYLSNEFGQHDLRKIIQFGMLEDDMKIWGIETIDIIYPNSSIKHGTVH
jgi:hypothetical protein